MVKEVLRYAEQYQDNLSYKQRYEKARDRDVYFQKHESEISLSDGAAYMLRKNGIDPDSISVSGLQALYNEMNNKKKALLEEYAEISADVRELEKLTVTLERYLESENKVPERARSKELSLTTP